MLRPASAEFVELCRSQITILTQSLGASLSAVYLTEHYLDRSSRQLIPIAAYPDRAQPWNQSEPFALQPFEAKNQRLNRYQNDPLETTPESEVLPQTDRLILPLTKEKMLMGFLVTQRKDRQWNQGEREQIQQITNTLAIACLLDQRTQWLEQRYQQYTQLQDQRRDLFHNFLHQFRNPLTALGTFGKLLLKRLPIRDSNRSMVENILRENGRLQDLLNQFNGALDSLDRPLEIDSEPLSEHHFVSQAPLAQLPGSSSLGAMALTLEPCSIEAILNPLLLSIEAIAEDRQLTLHRQIVPDLPLVQVDSQALTEVLNNLLENALKYTPAHGEIYLQVALHSDLNSLLIAISDTGLGIPPEDIEHIFQRHYRGIQAESTIPGTGLGLAIAKDLIEQMQGMITVFSPAAYPPNATQGTTFVISLPV